VVLFGGRFLKVVDMIFDLEVAQVVVLGLLSDSRPHLTKTQTGDVSCSNLVDYCTSNSDILGQNMTLW
jgi:hypothetical protein